MINSVSRHASVGMLLALAACVEINSQAQANERPLDADTGASHPIVEDAGGEVSVLDANTDDDAASAHALDSSTHEPDSSATSLDAASAADADARVGDAHVPVRLSNLQDSVFEATACAACHPSMDPAGVRLNFSNVELLYAALVTDTTVKCNGKPYVTPGDPSKSWFYDTVSMDKPGCNTDRMPQGLGELTTAQLKEISDWIKDGALR